MLLLLALVLVACWVIGLALRIVNGLIHLFLFFALLMVAVHFIHARRMGAREFRWQIHRHSYVDDRTR